jgi:pyruvate/2-oxoglutarate dehydrogenase complex dihydrolipoamide acyltransferase (E2) component
MFQDYKVAYLREHVKVREERPMSFIRQSVSYVLSQANSKIPHAAMNVQYDVEPLLEYTRTSGKNIKKESGASSREALLKRAVRKSYSAFFLKALAHSIYHTPEANAFLDYTIWRRPGTLYIADDINLGYTVQTNFGVIKPVVRNPHEKTIEKVADEMRNLTRRARKTDANELYRRTALIYLKTGIRQLTLLKEFSGTWMLIRALLWKRDKVDPALRNVPEDQKLQARDILGATCTLTNTNIVSGNPTLSVIQLPEVLMFCMSEISPFPWVVGDKVVPRNTIVFTITFDHRAYDAAVFFPIVGHLKRYIENPEKIYEWKEGDII